MTLEPYDPEMLDEFSLRLLDLACLIREMSRRSREEPVEGFALHDKKAREWIGNLERWARRSRADLEMKVIDAQASQRARTVLERKKR
jgi:hypothetical protein